MTGNKPAGGKRAVVIHGHFYQPPRENPWLDAIDRQESAAPYHDWNERIYDQCYRPNAFSRILDPQGMIVDIYNNYRSLSFNFGPTLFRWLETYHPRLAEKIVQADRESYNVFKKHGNALAQVYNHLIMPLSSRRDQLTQIRWAKTFFQSRFNRPPEGLWLAETALNMETVQCCIEEGIRFVVLSPNQAEAIRPLDGAKDWTSVVSGSIDTRRPYRIVARDESHKPTGGHLDVFFFDEGLSRAVSFENILTDAKLLADRIRGGFDEKASDNQIVTIATDGETFGHHKPFGDMCLAYFFSRLAPGLDLTPVNFGYYLELNPPRWEVGLKNAFGEGTGWSCMYGVGRWVRDCGCSTGGLKGWNQTWRTPLRKALQDLQKQVDAVFEKSVSPLGADPWALRDGAIKVFEAEPAAWRKFLLEHGCRADITDEQARLLRRLCEAQKYMLFSFTSCGWFFA
ncbi:MAG: DUF3536 domain-containing protein, partial [Chitinivibrionales bacterium]|nr:DUF3536 domain-containing protein [Chitinivibrionales bacterium]